MTEAFFDRSIEVLSSVLSTFAGRQPDQNIQVVESASLRITANFGTGFDLALVGSASERRGAKKNRFRFTDKSKLGRKLWRAKP